MFSCRHGATLDVFQGLCSKLRWFNHLRHGDKFDHAQIHSCGVIATLIWREYDFTIIGDDCRGGAVSERG